ncbi:MAG: bifunctional cytidylyltransferase/SDR family oxidoreductase [Chlamydiae bacterium]|nr:bifunctional cytidylyltransferase/SDR family oxidoreductase [Chlamydiota bacterium]
MTNIISAIILMGGAGYRFKSSTPKQFHRLSGKAVFLHTLEVFLQSSLFFEIILVCPDEWMFLVKQLIDGIPSAIPIRIATGGKTRQQSSYLGLKALSPSATHVMIHDGVRPFVTKKILKDNVSAVIEHGAIDTCIESTDTVVYSTDSDKIDDIPIRNHYLRGQTPQSFEVSLLKLAHTKAIQENILDSTDDCSLVKKLGHPVHIVKGSESNIKITTKLDMYVAEQILRLPIFYKNTPRSDAFSGKTYILTGASGGIGSAIARFLETAGSLVIPVSRNATEFPADLSQPSEAKKVFDAIYYKYGPVDGLINSVGQLIHSPLDELSNDDITSLIATNLHSVIFSCRHARIVPQGHILNIASSSYFKGRKNYAVYSATKAAVVNFTQGIAEEKPGFYINTLLPQRTATPMRQNHFPHEPQDTLIPVEAVASMVMEILGQSDLTGTIFEVRNQ